ncbi:EVE domain-containing protein [Kineococcus gynurae]|uniref:EVE domain-containing protein n=1 Tax=Kineococcus gynurae TaxID=452979 RepID=A0ABV5LQ57_9ACTN
MSRAWLLSCNPRVWRVEEWLAEGEDAEPLTAWTVRHHRVPIAPGDDVALWVSGADRGVRALGRVTEAPFGPVLPRGRYWAEPPRTPTWMVGVEITRRFPVEPLSGEDLRADPGFAGALILRLPRAANPVALQTEEWAAIERLAGERDASG